MLSDVGSAQRSTQAMESFDTHLVRRDNKLRVVARLGTQANTGIFAKTDKKDNKLTITLCMPTRWHTYSINYRFMNTHYNMRIKQIMTDNKYNSSELTLDGKALKLLYILPWMIKKCMT